MVYSGSSASDELRWRINHCVESWRVGVERLVETDGSILLFGRRADQSVVLRIARRQGDEWRSGDILRAFGGRGVVRVLDHADGAVLLAQLHPGTSLATIAMDDDDRATEILAEVIGRLSPSDDSRPGPAVEKWSRAFGRYESSRDDRIPRERIEESQQMYLQLCASQSATRLLHGDLHHYNVLLDSERGWLAIDPKGVVGECEYETGAAFRNPYERPELFTRAATIERRVKIFERVLRFDAGRILGWAFAQSVLSVVWAVEDGEAVGFDHPCIKLANTIRPMLGRADL